MPPKKPKLRDDELFRMQLTNTIDMAHPLVRLAGLIDWSRFEGTYGKFYTQKGRPALPTRLMTAFRDPDLIKEQPHTATNIELLAAHDGSAIVVGEDLIPTITLCNPVALPRSRIILIASQNGNKRNFGQHADS